MDQQFTPRVERQSITDDQSDSVWSQVRDWMRNQLPWWSMSFTVHVAALASLLLLGRYSLPVAPNDDIATFLPAEQANVNREDVVPLGPPNADVGPTKIDLETTLQITGVPDAQQIAN